MKRIITTVALFTVLGTLAVSCQKDSFNLQDPINVENAKKYSVIYSIDGKSYHITLTGDNAWRDFLDRMFDLAEKGHRVTFCNEENHTQVISSKETIKFTTIKRQEAYEWAEQMVEDGYTVTVDYDSTTGIYTCTAIK